MGKLISVAALLLLAFLFATLFFYTRMGKSLLSLVMYLMVIICSLCIMPFLSLAFYSTRRQ